MTVQPDFAAMRHAMVASQLRTNAVDDARVVAAMAAVPREAFLPPAQQALAYRDGALPLGGGRRLNPPIATARLLTAAQVRAGDRVLLIGAATGYAAVLLAQLGAEVTAVECEAALAAAAPASAKAAARWVVGPLVEGDDDNGLYDLLVIDGAVEQLPDPLLAQVRNGGRIATGIADRGVTRLATGVKSGTGVGLAPFTDTECAILPGFDRPGAFSF